MKKTITSNRLLDQIRQYMTKELLNKRLIEIPFSPHQY
jgi:hypothetical protein